MELQNNITDNFLDAEYQYIYSNEAQDEFDSVLSPEGETLLDELYLPVTDNEGQHHGGYRSKNFSEMNPEPQDLYYDN